MSPTAPRIHELSERIRNQIAAGEVVERPSSVVKELVENALDAGAGEIRVDLEEGGVRLIRVVDDGCGMEPADLPLAFLSHATSKLREVGDLEHIGSLGFRGEALASIGSVSRTRLLSRSAEAATGAVVEDEGGRLGEVVEAGAARGTTVEVRDLFYNTPARRRFLKRTSTELGRCLDVLQRLALAHPGVGFVVTHDRARVFDVEASMNLRERIRRLFGAELAEALVPVGGEDGDTRLAGFVAPPRFARSDTSRQMWFLNGRPLRDKVLVSILKQGYRGFLVEGRQPVAFLVLSMDPGRVDVNVHPTKSEVRFRDQKRIFGFLVSRIREAVATTDMSTPGERLLETLHRGGRWQPRGDAPGQVPLPDPGTLVPQVPPAPRPSGEDPDEVAVFEVPGAPLALDDYPTAEETTSDPWAAVDDFAGPYLQIDRTYLVRALPDGFEIIDQHALHERITVDALQAQVRRGQVEVQRSLVPELVEVSRADVELLQEHLPALARAGLHLSVFGEATLAVQGLPALMRHPDAEGLVRDVIEIVGRTGEAPGAADLLEEVLHRAACRSSVMAGDQLSQVEIRALLERGAALESDQTCPHARPTRVRFSLADLEKAFHRR